MELSQNATRYIRRLDPPAQERVAAVVREMQIDPFGPGTKPLAGSGGNRAARVGGWRVIFQGDSARQLVSISEVGPRGQIYRNLR